MCRCRPFPLHRALRNTDASSELLMQRIVHLVLYNINVKCRMCDSRSHRREVTVAVCSQSASLPIVRQYGSKSRISRLFAEMIMPRSPAGNSRRKTLPLSVITPSIWPRGGSPYWLDTSYVRVCLLNESACFHGIGNGIAVGLYEEAGLPYPSFLFLSLSRTTPWKHGYTRTQGGAKSRGDTDSHGPYVSLYIVYTPISHSIWLHSHTHTHRERDYPHSSLSTDLHK